MALKKKDGAEPEENPVARDETTPSGAAFAKVGEPPEKASDEELNEHAAKYAAEKRKVRWG